MARIFIDTNELRDIGRDLRRLSSELGGVALDVQRGWATNWVAPPAGVKLGPQVAANNLAISFLATRLTTDSVALEKEAIVRDAEEAVQSFVTNLLRSGRTALRKLEKSAWDVVRWGERKMSETVQWLRDGLQQLADGFAEGAQQVLRTAVSATVLVIGQMLLPVPVGLAVAVMALDPWVNPGKATLVRSESGTAPASLEDCLAQLEALDPHQIAVVEVAPGRYVVYLPGVPEGWDGLAPDGAAGWQGALTAKAKGEGAYERAVRDALKDLPPNAEVMLVGHSHGGLVARALADRPPSEGPTITHVATVGSPVDGMRVAPGIQALQVDNNLDHFTWYDGNLPNGPNVAKATFADWSDSHGLGGTYTDQVAEIESQCADTPEHRFLRSADDYFTGRSDVNVRHYEVTNR